MISTTELSSLLADLYSTPLEPARWGIFLDRLCWLTNSSCGYVMGAYQNDGNVILAGGGQNYDPEFFRLYSEHYSESDPFRPGLGKPPVLGLNDGRSLVNQEAVVKTDFYNDLLLQYDMEYMSLLLCSFNETRAEGLSLWRNHGHESMTKESEQLLRTLIPHVQTVLALRSKISSAQSVTLFSEAVMDGMSIASLLLDGEGRVRLMNRRAELCLSKGAGLTVHRGRLVATHPQDTARLYKLVRDVTANDRAIFSPGGAIRIARSNASPLHVSIVPTPSENTFGDRVRYAVVFLSDQSEPQGNRSETMRQLYQLTPTEARIADLICSGLTIKQSSELLRITLEAARFLVKQILSKTGVRRQADLMRLMLSLPVIKTVQQIP